MFVSHPGPGGSTAHAIHLWSEAAPAQQRRQRQEEAPDPGEDDHAVDGGIITFLGGHHASLEKQRLQIKNVEVNIFVTWFVTMIHLNNEILNRDMIEFIPVEIRNIFRRICSCYQINMIYDGQTDQSMYSEQNLEHKIFFGYFY